jgi:glycosyltransferase involved in cell wall biosynthesis
MELKDYLNLNPQLSIITSVFNDAPLLARTIESVRSQSGASIEYIVVDGGSTDGTVDVIKKYESQIDYWLSEPDKGIYDAWNKGLKLASGEWIAFLGAGDVYKPDAISTYISAMAHTTSISDLICSRIQLVDERGLVFRKWGKQYSWPEFRKHMEFAHVGALHHRSLFERYGSFDTSYKSAGDYDFFMRCGKDLRTMFIDSVTADVLVGGISMNNSAGLLEVRDIQKKYGMNPIIANCYYYITRIKQRMRPLVRGY